MFSVKWFVLPSKLMLIPIAASRDGVLPLAVFPRHQVKRSGFSSRLARTTWVSPSISNISTGFFKKVMRTRVVGQLGPRALLNGTLFPAPHLGRRHAAILREVRDMGFETGIHCHDHHAGAKSPASYVAGKETREEFARAAAEYERIFAASAKTAGAPGWQCSANSLQVYDEFKLLYASDTRGSFPFMPRFGTRAFATPQIPTTLPTLDEILAGLNSRGWTSSWITISPH